MARLARAAVVLCSLAVHMHDLRPSGRGRDLMRLRLPILAAALTIACGGNPSESTQPGNANRAAADPGARGVIAFPDDSGDWVRPAKDYSSSRYSTLTDITAESVKQLGVKVTFSTGASAGHEAAPLVVNNTMYIVTPWPNVATW